MQIQLTKNLLSNFSASKSLKIVKQSSGIIIDGRQYLQNSFFYKLTNRFQNTSALGQMQKQFKNFNRITSIPQLILLHNNFLDAIKNYKIKQIQQYAHESIFSTLKSQLKKRQQIIQYQGFEKALNMEIAQARSKVSQAVKSDVWYQLICKFEYQNKKAAYHAIQRHKNSPHWKFLKFNL